MTESAVDMAKELCELLAPGAVASRTTRMCPMLNAWVGESLDFDDPAVAAVAAWGLVEEAVATPESPEADSRPLLTCRYLLTLGVLPERVDVQILELGTSLRDIARNLKEALGPLDLLNVTGQRQMLAAAAFGGPRRSRKNWTKGARGTRDVAVVLLHRIEELMADPDVAQSIREQARRQVALEREQQLSAASSTPESVDDSATGLPAPAASVPVAEPVTSVDHSANQPTAEIAPAQGSRTKGVRILIGVVLAVVAAAGLMFMLDVPPVGNGDGTAALNESGQTSPFLDLTGSLNGRNMTTDDDPLSGTLQLSSTDNGVLQLDLSNRDDATARNLTVALVFEESPSAPGGEIVGTVINEDGVQSDIPGARLAFSPPDNCSATPILDAGQASMISGGSSEPIDLEHNDSYDWDAALDIDGRRSILGFDLPEIAPGEDVLINVPVTMRRNQDGVSLMMGGDAARFISGTNPDSSRVASARRGDTVRIGILIADSSCTSRINAQDVLVRASFQHDVPGQYSTLTALASTDTNVFPVGSVILSLIGDGDLRFVTMPGTTKLFGYREKSGCDQPVFFRELPDGVTQGGVALDSMYGYFPRDPCGSRTLDRWVVFSAKVV